MAQWKKYLIGEWNWKRPFKSLIFIYLSLLLVAMGCSNQLIYHPPQASYTAEGPSIHTISGPDGQNIGISHLPASPGHPTLLWSHGNAEDIGALYDRFRLFQSRGYGVLAYDYPGYGISQGTPSEQGCYDACEAAWKHLTGPLGVSPDKILIYGQSVGSGPACWLANRHSSAGLILVTPLTSAFRTVTRIPIFPGDQYPNIKRIPEIRTPLLVIHGDRDQVVKQWHGKKIHQLHPGPKRFVDVPGAGHNDLYYLAGKEILDATDRFWSELSAPPRLQADTKKIQ